MREIRGERITETVARLCIEANCHLPQDMRDCIGQACQDEPWPTGREILERIIENYHIADERVQPICQDTGMACVFLEIGQDVHICGNLEDAVNEGVRRGYTEGYLRKSVVADPLNRVNTGDNTPAVIHEQLVAGDRVTITVAPKGFGSENMSCLKMFTPAAGREDIIQFVLDSVKTAGGNPCPPIVLGIGIGGDFEQCAYLAKKALCRPVSVRHEKEYYKQLELELLERINQLGVGPQGFGGRTTALAVNVETAPTHIAGLPVAVNFGCHVTRHMSRTV